MSPLMRSLNAWLSVMRLFPDNIFILAAIVGFALISSLVVHMSKRFNVD